MTAAARCPNHRNRKAVKRGLCLACYNTLAKRVSRGLTTWAELEREDIAGPAERGRPVRQFEKLDR